MGLGWVLLCIFFIRLMSVFSLLFGIFVVMLR